MSSLKSASLTLFFYALYPVQIDSTYSQCSKLIHCVDIEHTH